MEPVKGMVAAERTLNEGETPRLSRKGRDGGRSGCKSRKRARDQSDGRQIGCWADGLFCSKMFKVKGHSSPHSRFIQRMK